MERSSGLRPSVALVRDSVPIQDIPGETARTVRTARMQSAWHS